MPRVGYTDLKSQMTRAAQSIVDNIVEGCGAASRLEFARYLDISIKSTSEVDYQLEFARDLGVMSHDVWKPLAKEVIEIRKMLSALRRSILAAAACDKTLRPAKQTSSKPGQNTATRRSRGKGRQRTLALMTDHRPPMNWLTREWPNRSRCSPCARFRALAPSMAAVTG